MSESRHEPRWRTAVAPAALLVAVALWTGDRVLFVAAALPLGYLAYGALSSVPDVSGAVRVERSLSSDTPFPGEHVEVTLAVTNESGRSLPDLRLVDDVPDGVEPVSGSPEAVFGLRPGETHEVTYELVAQRGAHEFGDVSLRARSLSAAAVSSATVTPAGDSGMFCRVHVEDAPVRDQTMQFVGAIPTQTGGAGIEFHSTRNYRRGDPMNRIDWRRLAKTGELTTIDYRVQEAARVMVVVDARESVAVSCGPEYPSSRELSSYAAELLTGVLLDEGHEVGIGVFGLSLPGTRGAGSPSVLEPSGGDSFRAHVSAVCSAVAEGDPEVAAAAAKGGDGRRERTGESTAAGAERPSVTATPSADGGVDDADAATRRLRAYLDRHTQVLFVTPALDEFPVTVTETLAGHGHAVTVVAPDVTDGETLGGRVSRVTRTDRVRRLRETGAHVVDWSLDDPLPLALAPAFREVR
ncbi:DUF58 domain-containing protein [Halorubellus sp. PRR65]|uniref:DUF58 domain-containing protein n=1 Tax=Halorubellus sp. PRR65 TaxID=3098148 RepID=UPI002B261B8D|nr:DUF58 domain-containing protein [Halorubellus sp. PRR65]